ncbi:MAG: aminoacyl-histidine dipeptidase [Eubacterium sp.]|nr:aminoacyl-histidine dipeptidase [Eubacterium sp.]
MSVLGELEPKKVFYYFEQIASIPHGSGDTKRISDYISLFAERRGLRYHQDSKNNVIIWKSASDGAENAPAVILQGHMDMVCEKEDWCDIDFESDGLSLKLENGIISAEGTTLGGDDGIAVAYMLALLDSDELVHPPLECVFTVDEEIGLLGAASLDVSLLKGRYMINLDSEDEGHIMAGCAGGTTITAHIPYENEVCDNSSRYLMKVSVSGLLGGHSGQEIDKGRANADSLLGRILYTLKKADPSLRLVSLKGGSKDNAIPRNSSAFMYISDKAAVANAIKNLRQAVKTEYRTTDPDIIINNDYIDIDGSMISSKVMTSDSTERVISALFTFPTGLQSMSFEIPGLPETSLNLGILETRDGEICLSYMIRSSLNSKKSELSDKLKSLTNAYGGITTVQSDFSAWEYNPDSELRDIMINTYRKMFDKEPVIEVIHAAVECGLFTGRLPGLDAVSIGPDMKDIHTPNEALDAASVKRTWDYVLEVLKQLAEKQN